MIETQCVSCGATFSTTKSYRYCRKCHTAWLNEQERDRVQLEARRYGTQVKVCRNCRREFAPKQEFHELCNNCHQAKIRRSGRSFVNNVLHFVKGQP